MAFLKCWCYNRTVNILVNALVIIKSNKFESRGPNLGTKVLAPSETGRQKSVPTFQKLPS